MNAVIQNIMSRRSCRSFDPTRRPTDEVIAQICAAGTWAPTGKGYQNPVIMAVTNPEMVARISQWNREILVADHPKLGEKPDFDPFYGAPCMLIVLCKDWYNAVADGSCVMQTLMLAAESLGVNTCWVNRAREEFATPEGKALLSEWGLEGDYVGIGHIALGYANKTIPSPRPRKEDYVRWVR